MSPLRSLILSACVLSLGCGDVRLLGDPSLIGDGTAAANGAGNGFGHCKGDGGHGSGHEQDGDCAPEEDAGGPSAPDAGPTPPGGVVRDAGPEVDAGAGADAGASDAGLGLGHCKRDGGHPAGHQDECDAGSADFDAGQPEIDAGQPELDAGQPGLDAGQSSLCLPRTATEPAGACNGAVIWTRSFYASGGEGAVNNLAADCMGRALVVGAYTGQLDLGQGQVMPNLGTYGDDRDGFLIALTSSGDIDFTRGFGGTSAYGVAWGVAGRADGDLLVSYGIDAYRTQDTCSGPPSNPTCGGAGRYQYVAAVDRFSPSGAHRFTGIIPWIYAPSHLEAAGDRAVIGGSGPGRYVTFSDAGSYVSDPLTGTEYVGNVGSDLDGNGIVNATNGGQPQIQSRGPTGALRWSKTLPVSGTPSDLATLPDGTLAIAGEFQGSFSFGGGSVTSHGGKDAYIALLDPATGAISKMVSVGGTANDTYPSLASTPSGDLILATNGSTGITVKRLAPDFSERWSTTIPGAALGDNFHVEVDPRGDVFLASTRYQVPGASTKQLFVSKLSGCFQPAP